MARNLRKETIVPFFASDKAARRVIAPYVKIIRKGQKAAVEPESKQFTLQLQKKPSVLLHDLSSFLSDNVDLPSLLHESSDVLKLTTKASGVALYMVDASSNEIYQSQKHFDIPEPRVRWKVEEGTIVSAHVASVKEFVMVDDILEDARFPLGIGQKDQLTKAVLCVPVVTPDGDCFAVIELFRDTVQPPFTRDDLKIVIVVTGWMGAAIHQNQQRLAMHKQQELNDYLLDLTKCYFEESVLIEKMITETVKFAKLTLNAERGSFYIIDREADEPTADLYDEGIDSPDPALYKRNIKVKLSDSPIVSLAIKAGGTINIKDAFNDLRFARKVDPKTGFITRSVLCTPIIGVGVKDIMGVIQVVNKKTGCFDKSDEILCKTFSIYCALALHYANLNKLKKSQDKLNILHMDLLNRQLPPCSHDSDYFIKNLNIKFPFGFLEFKWYIPDEMINDMPQLAFHMVKDLSDDDIDLGALLKFVLTTKKLYRQNPYHNFEHAFTVCHCMFNILRRNLVMFTTNEVRALIIAALCHDIDHGGCTNNFLMLTNDVLFQLYEEATWENYHFHITLNLLEQFPIYKNMSSREFKAFTKEVKDAILATDLASYFKTRVKLMPILKEESFDISNYIHRTMLKNIMMTVCDLSGQCKPYLIAKVVTDNCYKEFYNQGDSEKSMNLAPLSMMDRDNEDQVPEDQINFLTVIVLPATDILRNILPNTEELYEECFLLRKTWYDIIELRGRKIWKQEESLPRRE